MTTVAEGSRSLLLFRKARVTRHDERVFTSKLALAAVLAAGGAYIALRPGWLLAVVGAAVLGAVYTHMVELQHQCLHHSAFRSARPHRAVGIPLGIPLLVNYSHYRVRHLQHHRYLGTPQDSEFFGFDIRQPLTWRLLVRGTFDYLRLLTVLREIARSFTGRWAYGIGQISERRRRAVVTEYWLFGLVLAGAGALCAVGLEAPVLRLWLLPLLFAVPMHFLLELPEHILCDSDTTDVLRNTRSIQGSSFSTWFTNGNNLHVEHHAAMTVPVNRLRERHGEVRRHASFVERSYLQFYLMVAQEVWRNAGWSRTPPTRPPFRVASAPSV
jgi:fatty acid desaturase